MKGSYWNPLFETMERDKLEQIQLRRIKRALTYAYEKSPAYRELYDKCGIRPEEIQTIKDFEALPLVDKKFISDSLDDTFYGNMMTVEAKDVLIHNQTSGTTSRPICQPSTLEDWYAYVECWANVLWAQGVRAEDVVMMAFGYNLFIGFWGAHYGSEKIGATIIATGSMTSEQRLEKIQELSVTTLATTPTYAFRLHEVAEAIGIDTRTLGVKRIVCAGEPGALIPSVKAKLEECWNCDVYDHVGATEVGAWGFECADKTGGLHIDESMYYVEILDFETNEVITEPNVYGKLVVTAFYRKARPCIRFNTNDIACWQEGVCSCGRTYKRLKGGVQGRADYILKVKGTFVNPVVIEDIIRKTEGVSGEYLITIPEDGKQVCLEVEAAESIPESSFEELGYRVMKAILNKTILRFRVKVLPYGALPRSDHKSKRVKDLRKGYVSWK